MNTTTVGQINVRNALKIINMTESIDCVSLAITVLPSFLIPRLKNVNHAPLG